MTSKDTGGGPAEDGDGSWASETLPLAVRRQLLERELKKLAARHGGSQHGNGNAEAQQQQGHSGHPSADAPAHDERPG